MSKYIHPYLFHKNAFANNDLFLNTIKYTYPDITATTKYTIDSIKLNVAVKFSS